jgi:DNA-binding transcriptional regulator LsrR (DeoR family)
MRLAAELYYVRSWTQAEVADLLHVSISTVSRLLAQARADGIVQITVERDPSELTPLAREMAQALSVEVTLTPGHADDPSVAGRVCAVAAAPSIAAEIPMSGVLATAGGYTVAALAGALPTSSRPGLTVVPMAGGLHAAVPPLLDVNAITERIAGRLGASMTRLLAPGLLDSASTKEALLQDSVVTVTTALWSHIDCALVSVGGLPDSNPGYPTVMAQLDEDARRRLIAKGVVGEVAGHVFTVDGTLVEDDWTSRLLCISFELLRASGRIILVAAGSHKVQAIVGCARTGVVGRLYTDELTGASIMRFLGARRSHRQSATKPARAAAETLQRPILHS